MNRGRKTSNFIRGTLESAGLGEIAYFLGKAKQNVQFAVTALEGTDFSLSMRVLSDGEARLDSIRRAVYEMDELLEMVHSDIAEEIENKEEGEDQEI